MTDIFWFIERREREACRDGYWIESLCLSYVMLEVYLRTLLERKGFPDKEIDKQEYLIQLADFAHCKGFIDDKVHKCLTEFNKTRKHSIHWLVQGKVTYENIRDAVCGVRWVMDRIAKA